MGAARLTFLLALAFLAARASAQEPVIGLITKTESNPFFVKMREGAQAAVLTLTVAVPLAVACNVTVEPEATVPPPLTVTLVGAVHTGPAP